MNIEQLDNTRFLVSLSDKELDNLSLSFDKLSIYENNSRRFLRMILREASKETGVSFENKRVFIEAMRYEKGCLLLITVSDKTKKRKLYRIRKSAYSYLFVFPDTDSFLDCMAALYKSEIRRFSSTALRYRNRILLVIRSMAPLKKGTSAVIMEFAQRQYRGSISAASAEEHGIPIVSHNAVETIGAKCASLNEYR